MPLHLRDLLPPSPPSPNPESVGISDVDAPHGQPTGLLEPKRANRLQCELSPPARPAEASLAADTSIKEDTTVALRHRKWAPLDVLEERLVPIEVDARLRYATFSARVTKPSMRKNNMGHTLR